jgi:PAS domain-containing protein
VLFNIAPSDSGRPIQDLELSYRPIELRSLIDQAVEQRRPVAVKDVEWQSLVANRVTSTSPSCRSSMAAAGWSAPVSRSAMCRGCRELQMQLNRSKQDLETAYEELQSTNEELETTNEELQSTVEELETTNEELQSTNEELETMNEELQSTNEELQTINEELRQRSDDLNGANGFLESILTGVRSGVVVVDRELHVIAWNHRAEDMWGLRADEVRGPEFPEPRYRPADGSPSRRRSLLLERRRRLCRIGDRRDQSPRQARSHQSHRDAAAWLQPRGPRRDSPDGGATGGGARELAGTSLAPSRCPGGRHGEVR